MVFIYNLIYDKYYPMMPGTKKPKVLKVNEENSISYEVANQLADFGATLKQGTMMIDIDDQDDANLVKQIIEFLDLKCVIIQTSRGLHFHFQENATITANKNDYFTAIGVKTETKVAHKNVIIPVKLDGIHRKVIRKCEELDKFPMWLYPLSKKSYINFKELDEGDGRNDALFTYILTLQNNGLSKEEIREALRIINKFIIKTPVTNNELEIILRDESFKKESFYINNKLQYEKLAKYLIAEEHIIKINNRLHIYKNGCYTDDTLNIEKNMLKYIQNSTKTPRGEVIRYLELLCDDKKSCNAKFICFNNGVYDLENKQLLEHSPKYIITNKIPHNYNPNAYHELLDKTLNKITCNDEKLRLTIEEMIGYTFLRRNEIGKSFILTGNGSNGKSTLLNLIIELLGEDNVSAVSLKELSDRFKTYQLENKLANIGDDISNEYIHDNSTFKKLVTGDKVNVERKGRDPYDFRNYSKLLFSANELPRINDLSGGLKRRIVFIPFNAEFSKNDEDYDPFIYDKITTPEAMEYLLKIALEGLYRVLNNHGITLSKASEHVWDEYEQINNPVVFFLEEYKIENETINDVFRKYQMWCVNGGLKPLSKIIFGKEVRKHGYNSNKTIRIEGKTTKIYTKNKEA